ncbi:MAG: ABC transporter ATP-binding protein [Desulfobacterales bacterium]
MLSIKDLVVEVEGQTILNRISMEIPEGETHILFGPNGSGKSTLMMTIMGFSGYRVTSGRIYFKGEDITELPIHERARRGVGVAFQRPPAINGLKTRDAVSLCAGNKAVDVDSMAKKANFESFLDRDLNLNFSGGEMKRSEMLQLLAQSPDLVLLDEPESGVDLENVVLLGEIINELLERGVRHRKDPDSPPHRKKGTKSALVITHTGHILDYITADKGHVLYDGVLCCARNAREILQWIREYGYEECFRCAS